MFKFDKKIYLNNVAKSPKETYQEMVQATLDAQWGNTTQLYTIKEQEALPFTNVYNEIEAYVDTVSDDLVNYSKVYSDFVSLLFRNIHRKPNYKGQYYKMALDGEHEETYICYDRINPLSEVADCKCVRCNNEMTWIKDNKIIKMPCYLGTDISSTNNLISKDGTISNARMIILVQANELTESIVSNQRFLFQHSTAFKVEEINNYMQEQGTDGDITCIKIYVASSPLLPNDNLELNICDYEEIQIPIDDEDEKSHIVIKPNISSLKEKQTVLFDCKVLTNKLIDASKVVSCVASGVPSSHYILRETMDGYLLTNIHKYSHPLKLIFSATNCEDIELNIRLDGLL